MDAFSRQRAERITRRYPHYYQLHPAALLGVVEGPAPAPPPDTVHVVLDSMGQFSVVGVVAERRHAEYMVRKSPAYRRVHDCVINVIERDALDWAADEEQRAFLASLMEEEP